MIYPTSPKGTVDVVYNYDMPGRVSSVVAKGGSAFASYTFNPGGILDTEMINLGGTSKVRNYSYDSHYWLTAITNDLFTEKMTYLSGGDTLIEGFYHGLIASDTSMYYGGGPSTHTYQYRYDNFDRLTVANNSQDSLDIGAGAGNATKYDLNGNITYIKRGLAAGKTYTYYTGKNSVQTKTTGTEYTYDVTGNMLSSTPMGITLASYDPFTELVMKERKSSTDSTLFEYGGAKQRALKTGVATGYTLYIHGLSEYPLMEKTTSGTERMYVYGPTGLIAVRQDSIWYYVMKDHLGSVRLVMNTAGVAQATYDYDSYGKLVRNYKAGTGSQYEFTGQEFDMETGLYNFRARHFDTDLGMFCAADPAGSSTSPYGYAMSNPISFVDPTGMVALTTNSDKAKDLEFKRKKIFPQSDDLSPLLIEDGIPESKLTAGSLINDYGTYLSGGYLLASAVDVPLVSSLVPQSPFPKLESGWSFYNSPSTYIDYYSITANTEKQSGLYLTNSGGCGGSARVSVLPPIPPGVNLDHNVSIGRSMAGRSTITRWLDFYHTVKTGGPMDYKKIDRNLYVDFGNFNYGLVGSAAGFSPMDLLIGAGVAHLGQQIEFRQIREFITGLGNAIDFHFLGGMPLFSLRSPYGDQYDDQKWIVEGIKYFQQNYNTK